MLWEDFRRTIFFIKTIRRIIRFWKWRFRRNVYKGWHGYNARYWNPAEIWFYPWKRTRPKNYRTVRYDADSALCEDGLLHISESYQCQFCGAEWHVLQKFSEGKIISLRSWKMATNFKEAYQELIKYFYNNVEDQDTQYGLQRIKLKGSSNYLTNQRLLNVTSRRTIRRRYGIPPTNKLVGILPKRLWNKKIK